jgi:ferrochelatase
MSGGPWLGPTVESAMIDLKKLGHKGVVIAPIGFVCDHVEVLYDIDVGFKQFAESQGLRLWRTESLNVSPAFISALADLASSRLSAATLATSPVEPKA